MSSVCFYFQVHQPRRIKAGHNINTRDCKTPEDLERAIFNDKKNREVLKKVSDKCYYPANQTMLEQIDLYKSQKKKFKISYSLPGLFIESLERFDKNVLETFVQLAKTGCVEFLNETYYHSLSAFWGKDTQRPEFAEQAKLNHQKIKEILGVEPKVFRNTELLYNDRIAETVEKMGYIGMLAEGIEWILEGWRSPEHIYHPPNSNLAILLRHYSLSDDMSYRFSARWFQHWPVTAEKYSNWVAACQGETINLFMDYETFGEHQWHDTGIFHFLKQLPYEILKWDHVEFLTPSETIQKYPKRGTISVNEFSTISWADMERDTSAWLGNNMQRLLFSELERVGHIVKSTNNQHLLDIWRSLQTSDHLYYCCTKHWADGDVHKYFSPYDSPQESFEGMIKSLAQLEVIARNTLSPNIPKQEPEVRKDIPEETHTIRYKEPAQI
ncbi:MAG: glycoside hydrolase family 57 protein [Candidatus Aenigmarchaeota archaeon]|nr:glycoside hydrolase family 57 protein [Candidatus Aenigmarchaeota archaeon]